MTDFVKVFIETERGSDRQYKWNPNTQRLDTVRILPNSHRFPYSIGYIPNTLSQFGGEVLALCVSNRKHKSGMFHFGYIIGVLNIHLMDDNTPSQPIYQILIMYPIDDLLDYNLNEVYDLDTATLQQIKWFFSYHWEVPGIPKQTVMLCDFSHRRQAVEFYQDAISRWKTTSENNNKYIVS